MILIKRRRIDGLFKPSLPNDLQPIYEEMKKIKSKICHSFTKQSNFRNGTMICFLHFIRVTDVALGQMLSTSQIYINDDKQMYFDRRFSSTYFNFNTIEIFVDTSWSFDTI